MSASIVPGTPIPEPISTSMVISAPVDDIFAMNTSAGPATEEENVNTSGSITSHVKDTPDCRGCSPLPVTDSLSASCLPPPPVVSAQSDHFSSPPGSSGAKTPDPINDSINSIGHGQPSPLSPAASVSQARAAVPQTAMIIAINPNRVIEVHDELAATKTALGLGLGILGRSQARTRPTPPKPKSILFDARMGIPKTRSRTAPYLPTRICARARERHQISARGGHAAIYEQEVSERLSEGLTDHKFNLHIMDVTRSNEYHYIGLLEPLDELETRFTTDEVLHVSFDPEHGTVQEQLSGQQVYSNRFHVPPWETSTTTISSDMVSISDGFLEYLTHSAYGVGIRTDVDAKPFKRQTYITTKATVLMASALLIHTGSSSAQRSAIDNVENGIVFWSRGLLALEKPKVLEITIPTSATNQLPVLECPPDDNNTADDLTRRVMARTKCSNCDFHSLSERRHVLSKMEIYNLPRGRELHPVICEC
ncbi:hypothetical protein MMC22_007179 [Lobaria immixta]|nr:hypothetical protein [Lobaria immixta]